MNQPPLVSVIGAIAYDEIGTFEPILDSARNVPTLDPTSSPSLSSTTDQTRNAKLSQLHRHFGGCGGNLVFNLKQLGLMTQLHSTSGRLDDTQYFEWFAKHEIDLSNVVRQPNARTPKGFIFTHADGEQFTAFYPGELPSTESWQQQIVRHLSPASRVVIQAPFPTRHVLATASKLSQIAPNALKVWNPGQYVETLVVDEFNAIRQHFDWIVTNQHESIYVDTLSETSGSPANVIITTNGAGPVRVIDPAANSELVIEIASQDNPLDPTGCGDAFLAGVIATYIANNEFPSAVTAGANQAAKCLVSPGSQNH